LITLTGGDFLAGVASVAATITYTIFGAEVHSPTTQAYPPDYKVLAQGQLAAAAGAIYTVPASPIEGLVKAIHLANTSGVIVSGIIIYRGGTTPANQMTGSVSIAPNGLAIIEVDGWKFYEADGSIKVTGQTGAAGPQGVAGPQGFDGADGLDGINGNTGLTGATGATGTAGPQGVAGPQGFDGTDGMDGATGAQGPAGPAGTASLTAVTLNLGADAKTEHRITVVDGLVGATDLIMVTWGATLDTDDNGPDADSVTFGALAGAGSFVVKVCSLNPISKLLKINYLVG
jgi:hypothetical protein